jgi:hypothetical protein
MGYTIYACTDGARDFVLDWRRTHINGVFFLDCFFSGLFFFFVFFYFCAGWCTIGSDGCGCTAGRMRRFFVFFFLL